MLSWTTKVAPRDKMEDVYHWTNLNEVFLRLANMIELGYLEITQPCDLIQGPGTEVTFRFEIAVPYYAVQEVVTSDLAQVLEHRGTELIKLAAKIAEKQKDGNVGRENPAGTEEVRR